MRAKEINEFTQGQDPYTQMGIGKIAEAKELLDKELASQTADRVPTLLYKIHDLNNIEIYYNPEVWNEEVIDQQKKRPHIIKYIKYDQFYTKKDADDGEWTVMKRTPHWDGIRYPNKPWVTETYSTHPYWRPRQAYNKEADEKKEIEANMTADMFNKHYGPAWGFIKKED
jgi:hypothetical protein